MIDSFLLIVRKNKLLYFNQKLAEVNVEMWKDGVKAKSFLNVKNGILSKGSVGARNVLLLLLLLLLLLFKIWINE